MPITLVWDQGVARDASGGYATSDRSASVPASVGMSSAADEEILRFELGRNGAVVTLMRIFTRLPTFPARERP